MTTTPTTATTTTPPNDIVLSYFEMRLLLVPALALLNNTLDAVVRLRSDMEPGQSLSMRGTPESMLALYDQCEGAKAKRAFAMRAFQAHAALHDVMKSDLFTIGAALFELRDAMTEAMGPDAAVATDQPPAGDGASDYRAAADAMAATIDPPTSADPDRYRAAGECLAAAAATVQAAATAATMGEPAGTA